MRRTLSSRLGSGLLALAVAAAITLLLLVFGSDTPLEAVRSFFVAPLANRYYAGNLFNSMSSLIIAGIGVAIAFRAGMYNLGGEGQLYVSAFAATAVGLAIGDLPGPLAATIVVLCGAAVGALLAGLSGLLRYRWEVPELISSYLLAAAVIPLVDFLITGPANDPDRNLLATRTISEQMFLPRLLPPSELNLTFVIALLLALLAYVAIFRSVRGFELRLFGLNDQFAAYAGISSAAYTVGSMAVSGALHGLAGALLVLGTHHAAIVGFSGGIGWNAIAVALIGRLHPLGVVPAAFAVSYLEAGSKAAILHTDFSFELGAVIQSIVFFLVTARIAIPFVRRLGRRAEGAANGR